MKQFFIDLLLTIIFVAAISIPLSRLTNSTGNELSEVKNIHWYITHNSSDIKLLLLGHSHFYNSINPEVLGDSVLNASASGRVIYYDVEIAKRMLPLMKNLKTVIYPMHYTFENACLIYSDRNNRRRDFYGYQRSLNIPPPIEFQWEQFIYQITLACYVDNFSISRLIQKASQHDSITTNSHCKFAPLYGIGNWDRPERYTQIRKEEFTAKLTELAGLCNKYNIRFIVTTSPGSNEYLKHITPDGINNLYDVIANVSKKYPIEYKNYLNDSLFRNDSLYFDASHLNFEGATLFAQRVKVDFCL